MRDKSFDENSKAVYTGSEESDQLTPGQIAGFLFCCFAILFAYAPTVDSSIPSMGAIAWLLAAYSFYVLRRERSSLRVWMAWVAALSCTLCATYFWYEISHKDRSYEYISSYQPVALLGLGMIVVALSTLAAYRFIPVVYFSLAFAVALEAFALSSSIQLSFAVLVVSSVILIALNYLVKLFLDHERDARFLLRSKWSFLNVFEVARSIIGPFLIIVFAVVLGAIAYGSLKNFVKNTAYEWGFFPHVAPAASYLERDLRSDTIHAFRLDIEKMRREYDAEIENAAQKGNIAADQVPKSMRAIVGKFGGPEISSAGCEKLQVGKGFFGGGWGGLANKCRSAVASLRNSFNDIYRQATDQLVEVAQEKADSTRKQISIGKEEALRRGNIAIDKMRQRGLITIDGIFVLADVFSVVGFILVTTSLVGGLSIVLARRVFSVLNGVPFSLGVTGGTKPLAFTVTGSGNPQGKRIFVANYTPAPGDRNWYVVSKNIHLSGDGFMGPSIPQPMSCFFRRILTGRWVMQGIDYDAAVRAQSSSSNQSANFGPGTNAKMEFACMKVQPGQQIVFKMKHLIAFSGGVRLRTAYSAHVGLYFLGLSTFHCYAEGEGWIVFGVEGGGFKPNSSTQRDMVFQHSLIAWDRKSRFSIKHTQAVGRHWFSDSQIVPRSKAGTALLADNASDANGFRVYFARILGYLLVPF